MIQPEERAGKEGIPAPGLLILTGPSHVGKTSVAREVLAAVPPPAAYLSVDDVLERALVRPPDDDLWAQIPLAYELLSRELGVLLDHGWLVAVESTFTYVSEGESELHESALSGLIAAAESRGVPWLLTRLEAPRETILSRAESVDRLDRRVVAETIDLHERADLSASQIIDTQTLDPAEAATEILQRFRDGRSGARGVSP